MISENILELKQKINNICEKNNIEPSGIEIVVVTKNVDIDKIKEVINCNIKNIGENKVQEAEKKYKELREIFKQKEIKFHMIGHLQSNKVKKAVNIFDLIQSIDSINIAEKINSAAKEINKIQECLLQLKVSEEKTKFGMNTDSIDEFFIKVKNFENIKISGFMAMAPFFDAIELTRPYFKKMKQLFDRYKDKYNLKYLSMGMTNDFEIALEEGANMLRIGRFIFK